MIFDYFRMSFKYLAKKKLRAWLTIIGIILGTTTIVALIALGEGMQNAVEDQVLKIAGTKLRVVPGSLQGPPIGRTDITEKDAEAIDSIPGVEYVYPILLNRGSVDFGREEETVSVVGALPDKQPEDDAALGFVLTDGRDFVPSDTKVAHVGWEVANEIFDKPIRINNKLEIEGVKFKVVGLFKKSGSQAFDGSIRIPMDEAQDLFDQKELYSIITVKAAEGFDNVELADKIVSKLKRTRNDENFEVFTAEALIDQINGILDIVKWILVAIAAISLFVGSLGIMNSMFTSVYERTLEIGIMKAIGARNGDVLTMILIDSGIMGLVGGAIGVICGYFLAFLIQIGAAAGGFDLLTVSLNLDLVLYTVFGTFVIGMISGLIPALRAINLKPVDALRYE